MIRRRKPRKFRNIKKLNRVSKRNNRNLLATDFNDQYMQEAFDVYERNCCMNYACPSRYQCARDCKCRLIALEENK